MRLLARGILLRIRATASRGVGGHAIMQVSFSAVSVCPVPEISPNYAPPSRLAYLVEQSARGIDVPDYEGLSLTRPPSSLRILGLAVLGPHR